MNVSITDNVSRRQTIGDNWVPNIPERDITDMANSCIMSPEYNYAFWNNRNRRVQGSFARTVSERSDIAHS